MIKFKIIALCVIFFTSIVIISEVNSELQVILDTTPIIPIDPIIPLFSDVRLNYSSFIGGYSFDRGDCIVIDDNGYIWIAGHSVSPDYPAVGFKGVDKTHNSLGMYDVVVSKFSPNGKNLLLSTFIGGDGYDIPGDIAIDQEGNIWIVGHTTSSNFPTTTDALNSTHGSIDSIDPIYDGFICKIGGSSGAILYSTYIATDPGSTFIKSCAFDSKGDFWFTGYATSPAFPTTATAYDPSKTGFDEEVFISKLSSDGTQLLYSTYFGGSGHDRAECLVIDDLDNIWITGRTYSSSNFPITLSNAYDTQFSGTSDAFVSKFNFSEINVLQYSRYKKPL